MNYNRIHRKRDKENMRVDSVESLSSSLIKLNMTHTPSAATKNSTDDDHHDLQSVHSPSQSTKLDSNSLDEESRNEQSDSKSRTAASDVSMTSTIRLNGHKASPTLEMNLEEHFVPFDEQDVQNEIKSRHRVEELSPSLSPKSNVMQHSEAKRSDHTNDNQHSNIVISEIVTNPSLESTSSFHTSNSIMSTSEIAVKLYYENIMREQQKQHEDQIDEIIESLNSLETTYGKEIANIKDALSKKEVMTEALANQNMTLKNDVNALELNHSQLNQKYNRTLSELEISNRKCSQLLQEKNELEQRSKVELIEAVKKAQDEIRSAAESQFASANQTYVKLKQDYATLLKEKETMAMELTTCEKKMALKDREVETVISKYVAELAEVRAIMATAQADSIKLEQKYKTEMMILQDDNQEKTMKIEEQDKNLDDLRHKVDHAMKEKQDLVKENRELQSLCEELMAIVEGNASTQK